MRTAPTLAWLDHLPEAGREARDLSRLETRLVAEMAALEDRIRKVRAEGARLAREGWSAEEIADAKASAKLDAEIGARPEPRKMHDLGCFR